MTQSRADLVFILYLPLKFGTFSTLQVSGIERGCDVLPVLQVDSEARVRLGAELEDGSILKGQSEISHPTSQTSGTVVDKQLIEGLKSPIKRVFYLAEEGEYEVVKKAHPTVLEKLYEAEAVVYGE